MLMWGLALDSDIITFSSQTFLPLDGETFQNGSEVRSDSTNPFSSAQSTWSLLKRGLSLLAETVAKQGELSLTRQQ